MMECDVEIGTRHGRIPAFAVSPEGGPPASLAPVIFYMDAPGYREELTEMARRIAKMGYFCLLPDLYYRLGKIRLDFYKRDDAEMGEHIRAVMFACRNSLTCAMVVEDTAGMLAWLDAREQVKPGPVGIVGHCMSGSLVVSVAAHYPSRVAAAATFYGTRILTDQPDSPHLFLDRIKAELYLSFAEEDQYVPVGQPAAIKALLEKHGVAHHVEVVPGTHHGYQFPERATYHPEAAEAGWDKLFALFERNLS